MASSEARHAMPGLTLETDQNTSSPTQPSSQPSPARSRSSSPVRPPYSPITPVLGPAHLATIHNTATAPHSSQAQPARIYTHTQPPQTFIPPPLPLSEAISLDSNPDAIALRSAISILQIQRQKATSDIQTLQQIKERALADPVAFADAVTSGQIRTKPDVLFGNPKSQNADEGEDSDDEEQGADTEAPSESANENNEAIMRDGLQLPAKQPWPNLPTPQTIVRTPPINWAQYSIIGDSLDKLHADQVARPMEGLPARIGPDGQAIAVEGGKRNEGLGVAAPYMPGRDRIEKTGSGARKGGKR